MEPFRRFLFKRKIEAALPITITRKRRGEKQKHTRKEEENKGGREEGGTCKGGRKVGHSAVATTP